MSQPRKIDALKLYLKRDRRAGDLVFAIAFLVVSLILLSQLGEEAKWVKRTKFFAQPAFWPTVSLIGMTLFALLHLVGSAVSQKPGGRKPELLLWIRSLEYALWFLAYVWIVPRLGYLPSTLIFALCLTWRVGYRDKRMFLAAALVAIAIVVVFKAFLQVKIPAGQIYEYLPDGIRNFMLIYL
ncbi:MAG: tripartite tricarboxylate transporter TctB family protein [Pseudomonadota bacterium]